MGMIWKCVAAFAFFIVLIASAVVVATKDAPKQTNKDRGMLNFNESFGPQPKIKLCAVVENGVERLKSCESLSKEKTAPSNRD